MTTVRRVAASSGWWLGEKGLLLAVSLATNVVLVRQLGPSGFGELSYLLAVAGLLLPVAQLGVSGLAARALLERPQDERRILRAALLWRAGGWLAAFLLGLAYWAFLDPRPAERVVLLVLLAAQAGTTFAVLEFWFQARLDATSLVPWRGSVVVLAAAAKAGVAVATRDAKAVALVFAAEYLLLGATYLVAYRRASGRVVGPGVERDWLGWFGRRAPWLVASGIAEVIYLRIDIVMLERLRGVDEAGLYAVAARVSEIWYVIPVVIAGSMFPALWSRRTDASAHARGLQSGFDLLFAIALAIALLMQWCAGPLVELLFGARYAPSAAVLVVHIWAGVFVFMRALVSRWLLGEDLLQFSLVTHLAGALINVAANLVLIPRHGALGAAWATVLSYAAAGWLALALSSRTRPVFVMMGRSLLLPLRWRDLRCYRDRLRGHRGRRA